MRPSIVLAALTWVLLSAPMASAAGAEAKQPCPNEAVRIQEPFGLALTDCRAYEQVSPVEKNLADALGAITSVRSAPDGEAVTYGSLEPFPLQGSASEGSSQLFDTYLSVRGSETWPAESLDPPVSPGGSAQPLGVSEDLLYTFERSDDQPPLSPEGTEGREAVYMRENATGAERLLFQLPAGEHVSFFLLADAAGDSRIFFESANRLSPKAAPGTRNLYEWHEEELSLVDLLPNGSAPSAGAGAGQRGPGAVEEGASYFTQNAVSQDGSQVYFTDLGTGLLYVRHQQPGGEGETIELSSQPAAWQAATPDGSQAFYTQAGVLYDFQAGKSAALSPPGGEVLGVLGVSEDGSYVYFASSGALAQGAVAGAQNIYLSHEGAISLVSTAGEADDWTPDTLPYANPDEGARSARVSADGSTLMFTSRTPIAGYDNHGEGSTCEQEGAEAACNEIYLYDATEGTLACVSCNPAGTPATREALLYHLENDGIIAPAPLYPSDLPRNLSADGTEVFFETEEALLPTDTNGQMDVYEWEHQGSGNCPANEAGTDCLYLISTGVSEEPSYFAEAGANGADVFLFTRQPLVSQDEDELVDLYDARVDGGMPAQNTSASTSECSQESCHPPQPPATEVGPPISQTFVGPGNLAPQPAPTPAPAMRAPKKAKKAHKQHKPKHGKPKHRHVTGAKRPPKHAGKTSKRKRRAG